MLFLSGLIAKMTDAEQGSLGDQTEAIAIVDCMQFKMTTTARTYIAVDTRLTSQIRPPRLT